jgi:hypothetical protein
MAADFNSTITVSVRKSVCTSAWRHVPLPNNASTITAHILSPPIYPRSSSSFGLLHNYISLLNLVQSLQPQQPNISLIVSSLANLAFTRLVLMDAISISALSLPTIN